MNGPSAPGGCAPTAELLPELALGILGGADRAEVLAHLDQCASCREESAGWAATADALPALLTEAEPPAGFEGRTLERLRAARVLVPRRSLIRRILGVAAVVVAVMIVTLATVRIVDAVRDDDGAVARGGVVEVTKTTMIGRSGHAAGFAFTAGDAQRYLFVDVDYGDGSGAYRIQAVGADDTVTTIGVVRVKDGHGTWAGVIPPAVGDPDTVRMVDGDGKMFCWGRFGPVAT